MINAAAVDQHGAALATTERPECLLPLTLTPPLMARARAVLPVSGPPAMETHPDSAACVTSTSCASSDGSSTLTLNYARRGHRCRRVVNSAPHTRHDRYGGGTALRQLGEISVGVVDALFYRRASSLLAVTTPPSAALLAISANRRLSRPTWPRALRR